MEIKRAGSQPSGRGSPEYFTGTVRQDPLNSPPDPARVAIVHVTFPNEEKGKVFAYFGGSVKQPGGHERHEAGLLFQPDPEDRGALEQDGRTWSPAYLGPSGWLGLDLDREDLDWDEVAELVDASYRHTAPARLIRDLDAATG